MYKRRYDARVATMVEQTLLANRHAVPSPRSSVFFVRIARVRSHITPHTVLKLQSADFVAFSKTLLSDNSCCSSRNDVGRHLLLIHKCPQSRRVSLRNRWLTEIRWKAGSRGQFCHHIRIKLMLLRSWRGLVVKAPNP